MALVRSHLATIDPPDPQDAVGDDWAMVSLRLKGLVLDVYVIYLTDGIGFSGINILKLTQLAKSVAARGNAFCVFGDWNLTPAELLQTEWLRTVDAHMVAPLGRSSPAGTGAGFWTSALRRAKPMPSSSGVTPSTGSPGDRTSELGLPCPGAHVR